MNNWDRKIDGKLVWCLAGVGLKKLLSRKKKNLKSKRSAGCLMHVLVKKMLIRFNAIIGKVQLDIR